MEFKILKLDRVRARVSRWLIPASSAIHQMPHSPIRRLLGALRVRTIIPSVIVTAVTLSLVCTDTPIVGLSSFWAAHAVIVSLLINLLSLSVAVIMVDHYLAYRAQRQWQHVAKIAFQDLAREVMLVVRMMAELSGECDYRTRAARPMGMSDEQHLHELLTAKMGGLEQRKNVDLSARLLSLVELSDWGTLAYRVMQDRTHDGRLTIARWSPIMISNEALVKVLTKVAEIIRDIEIIQAPLVKRYVDAIELSKEEVSQWLIDWRIYHARCEEVHSLLVPSAYMYKIARQLDG